MSSLPRIRLLTIAASLTLAGSIAPAQAAPAAGAARTGATVQGQNQSQAAEGRRLCVRSEMPNPRIRRYLCRTQAQWDRAGPIPTSE